MTLLLCNALCIMNNVFGFYSAYILFTKGVGTIRAFNIKENCRSKGICFHIREHNLVISDIY